MAARETPEPFREDGAVGTELLHRAGKFAAFGVWLRRQGREPFLDHAAECQRGEYLRDGGAGDGLLTGGDLIPFAKQDVDCPAVELLGTLKAHAVIVARNAASVKTRKVVA